MSTELPEPDAQPVQGAEKAAAAAARRAQKIERAELKAAEQQERKLERQGQKSQRKALAKAERAEKYAKVPLSKRIALTSGRMLIGIAGVAVAALILGSVALVPWPSWGVAAPSVNVNPSAGAQQRVCAGPLLTVGANVSAVNTISSIGAATVVSNGGTARSLTTSNPNATADGSPQAFSADATAAPLAATQAQDLEQETVAGLAAAACTEPVTESWLVGGSTTLGTTAVLVLSNASDVAADVKLEFYGKSGPIATTGLGATTVEAGQQVSLPLAGYAPNEPNLVVHVVSQGGRIAAALDTTAINGLTPFGAEIIGPSAALATQTVIPGVVVDPSEAQAEFGEGADGFATVRMLALTQQTLATVTAIAENGAASMTFKQDLMPGQATDMPLVNLPSGTYSLFITAEHPIVAAAQSAVTAALPTTPATSATDYAWFASASALLDSTGLAVPNGAPAVLHFANPTATDATVKVGDQTVQVHSGKAVNLSVAAGGAQLSGGQGLVSSISLLAPGRISSLTVPGLVVDASSVSVYTR